MSPRDPSHCLRWKKINILSNGLKDRGFEVRSQGIKWGRSNKGQELEPSYLEETQPLLSLSLLPTSVVSLTLWDNILNTLLALG